MTVVRDSFVERATFTTVTPATSAVTPVGTPRSVTVFIAHGTESTDLIISVAYGIAPMTRVATNGFAQDTGGEPGAVYAYHLGSGIPAGVQTLSIVHTGSATVKWAITVLHTAAADTGIVASGKLEGDQANPQLALDTVLVSSIRTCILYSGHDAPASVAVLAGMEAVGSTSSVDFGTDTAYMGQQSTASTGSFTIGFTATSEDTAFIALAIAELTPPQTLTGTLFAKAPTFFTGTVGLGSTVTVTGSTVTITTGGTVTITGPTGVVYTGGTGTVVLPAGSYTWTSTDSASGSFSIVGSANRMGGSGAIRKPPRNVGR